MDGKVLALFDVRALYLKSKKDTDLKIEYIFTITKWKKLMCLTPPIMITPYSVISDHLVVSKEADQKG